MMRERPFEEEAAYELRIELLKGRSQLRQNLAGEHFRKREELAHRHGRYRDQAFPGTERREEGLKSHHQG